MFKLDYHTATVNQYYLEYPKMIIGELSINGRMYQSYSYMVSLIAIMKMMETYDAVNKLVRTFLQ